MQDHQPEEKPRPATLSETARLETFADGVMAIAITLLIIEVAVPHVSGEQSLRQALARQWPSYAAYVVSFLTIGIMWVNHHHMFAVIQRSTHVFMVLNVIFLMTIAALPWPTALVAAYIQDEGSRTIVTLVYGGLMVAIALMFNVVWRYAASNNRLLVEGINPVELRRANAGYLAGPVVYLGATLIALINPWISLGIFAALAIYFLMPFSGPRPERLLSPVAGDVLST